MARILILREREAGLATARLVEAARYEPVLLPLQAIVPLSPPLPDRTFGGLIVTSANALRSPALRVLRDLPVLAVGRASAEAAREAGFEAETAGEGTGASVGERAAALHAATGLPLLYVAGRVRTDGLERALAARGVEFETIETYDTRDVDPDPEAARAALARPVDAVLLLSLGQARAYARLIERDPALYAIRPTPLCLSDRIRNGLPPALAAGALVAPVPELSSLLARYGGAIVQDR